MMEKEGKKKIQAQEARWKMHINTTVSTEWLS